MRCFLSVDLDTEDIVAKNILVEITNVKDFKANNVSSVATIDNELNVISDGYGPLQIFAAPDGAIDATVFRKTKGEFRVYEKFKDGRIYTGVITPDGPESFEAIPEVEEAVDRIVIEDKSRIITYQDKMKVN